MERMAKKDAEAGVTSKPLSDAQKAAIAETRNFYEAKIAELEVLHQSKINATFDPAERDTSISSTAASASISPRSATTRSPGSAHKETRSSAGPGRGVGSIRAPQFLIAGALVLAVAAAALAQRRFGDGGFDEYPRTPAIRNTAYDGQFTFVRVKYDTAPGGYWAGGRPSLGARLSARRRKPDADHERSELLQRAHGRGQRAHARRSRAVQVSGGVHHRSRLVDAERRGRDRPAHLHPERRLRHRRRLQDRRLARQRNGRMGSVRAEHGAGLSRREILRHGRHASDLPRIFRDRRRPRQFSAGVQTAGGRYSRACIRTTTRRSGS